MKKRVFSLALVMVLAVVMSLPIMAEGIQEGTRQEQVQQPAPYGRAYRWAEAPQLETVTVSGSIEFTAGAPVIESDGTEYHLMFPRFLTDEVEIENGTSITVEGFEKPASRFFNSGDDTEAKTYLRLSKVQIDTQEYPLDAAPGAAMARGRGPKGRDQGYNQRSHGGSYGPGASNPGMQGGRAPRQGGSW